MKKIYLHVGADKCGSSAIQASLSSCDFSSVPEDLPRYAAITRGGLASATRVRRLLNFSTLGYVNSLDLPEFHSLPKRIKDTILHSLKESSDDLVLSCEGWLRSFFYGPPAEDFLSFITSGFSIEYHMLAILRPPVTWLNSAWWQWGAWEGRSFDQWLDRTIDQSCWFQYCQSLAKLPGNPSLSIKILSSDVISQLSSFLGFPQGILETVQTNQSLPEEILRLYQGYPQLRPTGHSPQIDFAALKCISDSSRKYSSPPWVLSPKHVSLILQRTYDSNVKLMELLDEESRNAIQTDSRWWDADAFADKRPSLVYEPRTGVYEGLCADLLEQNSSLIRILADNGLLNK